jgi:hypothetical protein
MVEEGPEQVPYCPYHLHGQGDRFHEGRLEAKQTAMALFFRVPYGHIPVHLHALPPHHVIGAVRLWIGIGALVELIVNVMVDIHEPFTQWQEQGGKSYA